MKLRPIEGWDAFSRSKELIDSVFRLYQNYGWHYIGPTSNTMIVEAPRSGDTIYLEVDGEKVLDAVISQEPHAEGEFEETVRFIVHEFKLAETE